MNVNDTAKRILCFGDSLTYGQIPGTSKRHASSKRWTGVLQAELGIDYEVIEEGLRSRTTTLDVAGMRGRNGYQYFYSCLFSHLPFDLLILLIGTNDLKETFARTVEDIVPDIEKYIDDVHQASREAGCVIPHILLLAPPLVDESHLKSATSLRGAGAKSQQFAKAYHELAQKHHLHFFDTATVVFPDSADGAHLSEESNILLGEALAVKVKKIFV